ncbi:MAG: hypothetical protein K2K93_01240 [Muribaculaceae bacterium]|nr:hypothetical protein [Muribaculaceae bacterium]
MSNDNLHNALRKIGESYSPGPDFTSVIMQRVTRRARRLRLLRYASIAISLAMVGALSVYTLIPEINPVIRKASALPASVFLTLCFIGVLLCLMLLADTLLRRKFMPRGEALEDVRDKI